MSNKESNDEQSNTHNEQIVSLPFEDPDEIFEGPGFVMARKGRFIFTQNYLSEDERREFLSNIVAHEQDALASLEQQVEELEKIIKDYNPFALIGNLVLRNSITDPEIYKESEFKGRVAFVEYLAVLCLTKPYEFFNFTRIEPSLGELIEEIQERIEKIFHSQILYLMFKGVDLEKMSNDILYELRFQTLGRSIATRYPAYFHHLEEVLEGIFGGDLREVLDKHLGFELSDFLSIARAIEKLRDVQIGNRFKEVRKIEKEFRHAVKLYRQKRKIKSDFPQYMLYDFAKMKPSEAVKQIRTLSVLWAFYGIEDEFFFEIKDIENETALEERRIKAYLDKFSLNFGEIPEKHYRFPAPTHPFQIRPIINYEEKYFCPLVTQLYYGFRPSIENLLNPSFSNELRVDAIVWEKYQNVRANYLEAKALECFGNALKYAAIYRNLKYKFHEGGKEKIAELDGLILLDSFIFLVEAKSGTVSLPARRGAKERIIEELTELVKVAYQQAIRAKEYIHQNNMPVFECEDGNVIVIDKAKTKNFLIVTVTLEQLDAFVTNIYRLQDLGFFKEGDIPWSVSITDLMVITEIAETSCEFIHYLLRRIRLNELGIAYAIEELDWFGYYLLEGLYFEDMKQDIEKFRFNLGSYTEPFDDYYLYKTGMRQTPAPKPRQNMPDIMKKILVELEQVHGDLYLKASFVLLDMDGDSRDDFAKFFSEFRKKTKKDRLHHDFSMPFLEAGFGVTCIFRPIENGANISSTLSDYCELKKYELKANLWVGFGCVVDLDKLIYCFAVIDSPWVQNQELENKLANWRSKRLLS